jgi:hypothetical protein
MPTDPDGLDELRAMRQQWVALRAPRDPWPEHVREATFLLWAGRGRRCASRVARLYQLDLAEGVPGPSAWTVRRWATQEHWAAWASGQVPPLGDQNPQTWRTMWLRHMARQLMAALLLERDALEGRCPGNPAAASIAMRQFLTQPGAEAFMRFALDDDGARLSPAERERLLRRRIRRAVASGE